MIVRQLSNKSSNNPVANQFMIYTTETINVSNGERREVNVRYFQSYSSIIVKWINGKVYLDKNSWDYSVTTGRYRNQVLGETKRETEKKIKAGDYILADLN